jgi:RHS repeat-associated protein
MGRLDKLETRLGSTVISSFDYDYDLVGNRTRKASPDLAENYGYDALGRLTAVDRTAAGVPPEQWGFAYDRVGNRVTDRWNGTVMQASHNERNELLSKQVGGPVPVEGQLSEAGTVQVNGQPARAYAGNRFAGQITAASGSNTFTVQATDASGNSVTKEYRFDVAGQPVTMVYDANGNLSQKVEASAAWSYEWTSQGQLDRVFKDGVEVARFAYDPLGRRVEKVAGGITVTWLYDGSDILRNAVANAAGTQTSLYVHGPGVDEPLGRKDMATGAMAHLHADGLGSIVKHTDNVGGVIHTVQYDAWGNIELGASTAGHSFTGREWDPETGLYYYRARYYDPKTGRFITEDPQPDDINYYGYVGNSPVSFSDPFGLERWDQWDRQPKAWSELSLAQQAVGFGVVMSGPYQRARGPNTPVSKWLDEAIGGAESQFGGLPLMTMGITNACKRWQIGDDILAPTSAGKFPSWSAQRARYWKNATILAGALQKWGAENLARMRNGRAPQRYNHAKPGMESMELSHEPIPQCKGGTNCVPRWPQDHAAVDPHRHPGY